MADAGVAVFVEKPLATDLATAEAIAARLRRARRCSSALGHHWRCAEPVARARGAARPPHGQGYVIPGPGGTRSRRCRGSCRRAGPRRPRRRAGHPPPGSGEGAGRRGRGGAGQRERHRTPGATSTPPWWRPVLRRAGGERVRHRLRARRRAPRRRRDHRRGARGRRRRGLAGGVRRGGVLPRGSSTGGRRGRHGAGRSSTRWRAARSTRSIRRPTTRRPCAGPPPAGHGCRALGGLGCAGGGSGEPSCAARPGSARLAPHKSTARLRPRAGRRGAGTHCRGSVPATDGPVTVAHPLDRAVGRRRHELPFTGTNPALHSSFDPELGLFRADRPGAGSPVERLGYMEVAEVVEMDPAAPGRPRVRRRRHRRHDLRAPPRLPHDPLRDRIVPVPPRPGPAAWGSTWPTWGRSARTGCAPRAVEEVGRDVRALGDSVRGRRVAVVGGGVVGLLTGLFARPTAPTRWWCSTRAPVAPVGRGGPGADGARSGPTATSTLALKTRWRRRTPVTVARTWCSSAGAAAPSLALALRLLRPQGTVIDLAFYTDDGHGPCSWARSSTTTGSGCADEQIGRVPRGTEAHVGSRERLSAATIALLRAHGPGGAGARHHGRGPRWPRARRCSRTSQRAARTSSRRYSPPRDHVPVAAGE